MEDKMEFNQIKNRRCAFWLAIIAFNMFFLSSCGGGNITSNDSKTNKGALSFQIVYHRSAVHRQPQAAVIDCTGEGVATVEASVYDQDDVPLKSAGPWDCEIGQGTISSVPAGSGRTVVILGRDGDGNVVFRGTKPDIQVDANSENDAGTIDCYRFVPSLQVPADGAVVNAETMGLAWNPVTGATEYHVRVSESDDLSDTIIDETISTENYTPVGLLNGRTYYWLVVAGDAYDNTGIESEIWSFSVNDSGPHGIMFLDSTGDVGMYSTIAVEDGKIFIGYYDETNQNLKLARSTNDGYNWVLSKIESDTDTGQGSSIAVDGENIFIATTILVPSSGHHVGISVSTDSGETWNTSTILQDSYTTNAASDEFATSIALDGQNIYITYLSYNHLTMKILKSNYSATEWTLAGIPILPEDDESGYYSSINVLDGMLYISHSAYTEGDVYFTKVPDTLSDPVNVLVDQIGAVYQGRGYTTSAVRQQNDKAYVYIAYFDQSEGNLDLKFGLSENAGDNFSLSSIDSTSDVIGKYPSMAISGDTIFIAYHDESNGNLKLAKSSNHGSNWDISTVDNSTDSVGRFASLAVDGSKVYISYYDETNKDLKFAKSIDGGSTW
jgi:hypothetical protein